METEFTPIASLIGGGLIGLSAVLLMWLNGRIAGVSGIVYGLLAPSGNNWQTGLVFLLGLAVSSMLFLFVTGNWPQQAVSDNVILLAGAGVLVGTGTALGGGCTSGHGVCGIARLSKRSIVATIVFMVTAFITVWLTRHGLGG